MMIDQFADYYLPGMGGWCTKEKAIKIHGIILERGLKSGVEIGVFSGRSLCAAGIAMASNGGEIVGIDPYQYEPAADDEVEANRDWWAKLNYEEIYQEATRHIHTLDIARQVSIVRKTSRDAYVAHKAGHHHPLDYLHIDGNHSQWASTFDVVTWVPEVKPGGIICMDDVNWDSTAIAQTLLAKKADFLCWVSEADKNCAFYVKR